MKNYSLISKIAASLLLVGMLTGCGSSNDSTPVAAAPAAAVPTSFTVSGTAATGAAMDGATVTITDAAGDTYPVAGETAILTGADGSYTIILPLTATPPFVVTAVLDDISLVSVVAEATDTTTNITPVTNLIASRLSSSGDPAKLAAELTLDPALFDATALQAKIAEIVALLQPLMDAAGDKTTNPLNDDIQAAVTAGTGADKVLDSLTITITPSSATTVNIEVAVKQKQTDESAQPAAVTFTGGNNATTPDPLPPVTAENLVPSGNAELIADLLQRITACRALPQAERVTSGGTTAADIIAPECKDIFFGNDPASYLSNGSVVSATGSSSGIFRSGSGAAFDRGSYEFTRANGDLVIGFRVTDTSGNTTNNTLVARIDTDGKLRSIGNQYKYDGKVVAYHQLRTFINQEGADYYSTGYVLRVKNNNNLGIAKVVVTSPKGAEFTLESNGGSSSLTLVKDGVISSTTYVRLRNVYADAANTKNPADADGIFVSSTPRTDEDIAAINAQGVWKFDYYLASEPTTIAATQYRKTRARAMTIAELQTKPMANIIATDIAEAKLALEIPPGETNTYLPLSVGDTTDFSWEVPAGAVEPTNIKAFGHDSNNGNARFDDQATVKSSARSGTIVCSKQSDSDTHCDSAGNYLRAAHLHGSDEIGREFVHLYAFFTIDPEAIAP